MPESDHVVDDSSLTSAFPAVLKMDVLEALRILPKAPNREPHTFSVVVEGERLEIPYRIYNAEPDSAVLTRLSPRQQTIVRCLYTRHHNGFIRERSLTEIIAEQEPWAVPYVAQLIGEYVLEIVLAVERGLPELDVPGSAQRQRFGEFVAENPAFFELIGQRVTSYWNRYYRFEFPRRNDYPGSALITKLGSAGVEFKEKLETNDRDRPDS